MVSSLTTRLFYDTEMWYRFFVISWNFLFDLLCGQFFWQFHLCLKRMCIFYFLIMMCRFLDINKSFRLALWVVQISCKSLILFFFFLVCLIVSFWERYMKISPYDCRVVNPSLYFLLNVFQGYVANYIQFHDFCSLVELFFLSYETIFLPMPLDLKLYVDLKIANLAIFF